jgi:predicted dienelactone hydrolase
VSKVRIRLHFDLAFSIGCALLLSSGFRLAFSVSSNRTFKVGIAARSYIPNRLYNWRGAQTHALLTTVWYPAVQSAVEQPQTLGPPNAPLFYSGSVASNAELAVSPSRFPLVLMSHGTGGSAMQLAWLGTYLASHGYIVAAVNHPGNNALEPYTIQGFTLWWLRAHDLTVVLDHMLADRTFGPRIDKSSIGAAGFSLGGYTMMEIAGGITNPQAAIDYCNSPRSHGTCNIHEFPALLGEAENLRKTDPEFAAAFVEGDRSYRDPRIRAVFAIAPALGPAFSPEGLSKISIPVEIIAGAADPIAPPPDNAEYFAHHIRGAKLVILPGGVAHYTFLDACALAGTKTLPVYCEYGPGVDRTRVHATVAAMAVEFFAAHLQ